MELKKNNNTTTSTDSNMNHVMNNVVNNNINSDINNDINNDANIRSSLITLEGELINAMQNKDYSSNIVKIVTNKNTNNSNYNSFDSNFLDNKKNNKQINNETALSMLSIKNFKVSMIILFSIVLGFIFFYTIKITQPEFSNKYINLIFNNKVTHETSTNNTNTDSNINNDESEDFTRNNQNSTSSTINSQINNQTNTITQSDADINNPDSGQLVLNMKTILNAELIKIINSKDLSKFEIISQIKKYLESILNTDIKKGTNSEIDLGINLDSFLDKIRYTGPQTLKRSFGNKFIYGIYYNEYGFFKSYMVIEVFDYDLAYAGLLNWESEMVNNLSDFYPYDSFNLINSDKNSENNKELQISQKTSTSTKNEYFEDFIIENKDVRRIISKNKNVSLNYGFLNKKYLIIAGDESTFKNVYSKLVNKSVSR